MAAATLGDLLHVASDHLAAAARLARTRMPAEAVATATWDASRVVTAMSRYLDDIVPYGRYEAVIVQNMEPWVRAAVDAREALEMAATSLGPDAGDPGASRHPGAVADDPLVTHLGAAATALTVGCDLLRSHFTTDGDGLRTGYTDWSAVIASGPFSRAMLEELARWSQQLSLMTAGLTPAAARNPAIPAPVHRGLASACHWLLTANVTLTAWQRHHPPLAVADTGLLQAVPPTSAPERRPPGQGESVSELCDGAAISAARLRIIARQTAGQVALSPTATAASWRWAAKAAAVTCHLSELMLTSAAERPGYVTASPAIPAQLRSAAAAAGQACARWREVAAAWKEITTETAGLEAPGVADTSDLVIRLGRLASGDPQWTPARAPRIELRKPAELVRSQARATAVVAAVHQAADALASAANADMQAVDGAFRAGRLYVPTRTLPESYDVPHAFGKATPDEVAVLLSAYLNAAAASTQAATALDAVAITLDAPSRALAAARAAAASAEAASTHGRTARHSDPAVTLPDSFGLRQPGSAEQAVRRLGAPDPVILLRAAAIDKAARELIAEAERSSLNRRAAPFARAATTLPQTGRTAAGAAAESFPRGAEASTADPRPSSLISAFELMRRPPSRGRHRPR